MQRKCTLFSAFVFIFLLHFGSLATAATGTARYLITSKWSNGAYINVSYWAMALAHASQLFKNVTGIQNVYAGPNHCLATTIQESRIGADPASATFTWPVAIQYPIVYQANTQIDRFFQSAITAAYYNIYMYQFLAGKGFKLGDFFSKTKDPLAYAIILGFVRKNHKIILPVRMR